MRGLIDSPHLSLRLSRTLTTPFTHLYTNTRRLAALLAAPIYNACDSLSTRSRLYRISCCAFTAFLAFSALLAFPVPLVAPFPHLSLNCLLATPLYDICGISPYLYMKTYHTLMQILTNSMSYPPSLSHALSRQATYQIYELPTDSTSYPLSLRAVTDSISIH